MAAKGSRANAESSDSALARELWQVPPAQRRAFGLTDEAIWIWDVAVSCIRILIDDSNPRPWSDRLDDFFTDRFGDLEEISEEDVQRFTAEAERMAKEGLTDWSKDIRRDGFQKFVQRAVGEAAYRRLTAALQIDAVILSVALRRATRGLMPYAVALDDLYSVLPEGQRIKLPAPPSDLSATMLSTMWLLDTSLEKLVEFSAPAVAEDARPPELSSLAKDDIVALLIELRELVSGQSRQKVTELSSSLGRKVQGARDALQYSADSVAQAANSLIELIDRLLRAAFSDAEVLAWIDQNYPESKDLTWADGRGVVMPTKRGQILCFVHAGVPVEKPSILHQLAATALATTRTQLQQLKHADQGTEEEMEQVQRLLAAVEGFLHLAIGVAWSVASDDRLESLRLNLDGRR
ncbi:hypothetical protein [Actinoplanes sp. N902-109]|uniref:hypothetical protein n=1 Tax=Actinoplanes sp. (strain N902-109) TaxID=649831 RepID=UPI001E2EA5AC|nr:hypothetical protein [Actinoplanes sp. N902-109]